VRSKGFYVNEKSSDTSRSFCCKNCVFIGTYTLQSQQVYSFSLLVSLRHTVHNVTASRDESLREWEMLLSKMYGAILSPFSSVLNESGAGGERGIYSTSRYLPTVGVLGARWYSFQRARCKKST